MCNKGDASSTFSLNTTRGMCAIASTPVAPAIMLPQTLVLSEPYFQAGQKVVIPAGMKLFTHGYPLTLSADKLVIEGASKIQAFDGSAVPAQSAGKYAGIIRITAKQVSGQGLTILNAGQAGGDGLPGAPGAPGPQGGPGAGRSPLYQNCPQGLQIVCNAIFLGCTVPSCS